MKSATITGNIHHINWEHRLLIEWRIPELRLVEKGILSVRNGQTNRYSKIGSKMLRLYIVGTHPDAHSLQIKLFGKLPRKDVDIWTSEYCSVGHLPEDVKQRM